MRCLLLDSEVGQIDFETGFEIGLPFLRLDSEVGQIDFETGFEIGSPCLLLGFETGSASVDLDLVRHQTSLSLGQMHVVLDLKFNKRVFGLSAFLTYNNG